LATYLVVVTGLPALLTGYFLLEWLADKRIDLLRLLLGAVIIFSSVQLARRPDPLACHSGKSSVLFFGGLAGLMGGLFSTAGPPLVYHFYRQPMAIERVRETLVTIFALNASFRLGIVALSGDIPTGRVWLGAGAIPVVMVATHAARRWPPPILATKTRRIVFVLLFLSGVALVAPAVGNLL
jgi:hypothetical protein